MSDLFDITPQQVRRWAKESRLPLVEEFCTCTGLTSQHGFEQSWDDPKVWICDECGRIFKTPGQP